MNFKAVIFDLDGVLCSTDTYHYRAWKALADRLNIPFDQTVNTRLRGVSRMESLNIILENSRQQYSEIEKEAFAAEKNAAYTRLLLQMTPNDLSAEVEETLDALRDSGLLLAVGSSSRNAKLILGRLGLDSFFDAVADGTEIVRSKPDPEVFLMAARKLGVAPAEAVVVEDAPAGIAAAKAGGFYAVAIGDAVADGEADVNIAALLQLKAIVLSAALH